MQERFPIRKVQRKVNTIMLTVKEREVWRNALIKELDAMDEQ
ncbi:MAG: hypothetical protein ACI936_000051 [Paraglaciecola sp.]|jgi:hypothetical protein